MKSTRPPIITGRRPSLSESLPPMITNTMETREAAANAYSTPCRSAPLETA